MSEPFSVQISSDLVRRLVGDQQKPKRRPKPKVTKSDHPKNDGSLVDGSLVEAKPSKEIQGWQPGFPPLLTPGVFPPVVDKELDPIRKVLKESEKVIDKLHKEEIKMAEEVKRKAKELHEKEYRMPEQKPVPCTSAKEACIQCYKSHTDDPLKCADVVKAFVECARQVQQQFVASG